MDLFLILVLGIGLAILLVVGVYGIIHFQHPDDKNDAYIPKFVVLIGFMLAFGSVMLLPLDVANEDADALCVFDSTCGNKFDMELFWTVVFWSILAMISFVIPLTMFYYEADDFNMATILSGGKIERTGVCGKLKNALLWEMVVALVFALILGISFAMSNESAIPVTVMTGENASTVTSRVFPNMGGTMISISNDQVNGAALAASTAVDETIAVELSFSQFLPAILVFIGYFFFSIFGGIGMVAIPMDLISSYINRPKRMDALEYANAQVKIRERVNALVTDGENLSSAKEEDLTMLSFWERRKKTNELSTSMKKFKRDVYSLESDYEILALAKKYHSRFGVLFFPLKLLLGVICFLLSVLWIIQVAVYTLPDDPIHPFLNEYMELLEFFPLLPFLTIFIFTVYLLMCVIAGNFKFGLNVGFFTIHPMAVNATYMSSMLFNLCLVLMSAIPIVQFTTLSLTSYARHSTVYQIFGTTVFYLDFFSFFFENHVFIIAFLASAALTLCYWILCNCRKGEGSKLAERVKGIASS